MNSTAVPRIIALTHAPSPLLEHGARTHVARASIDYARACQRHAAYGQMLRDCGAEVRVLDMNRDRPDGVFVEDTAVVLDEVAVLCSMGTEARRMEPPGLVQELQKHRDVERITWPASIEGGDVLRVGRKLFVGLSSRTNRAGAAALDAIVRRHGYEIIPVPVRGCLHLKTACTALPDETLLVNPAWLDTGALRGFERMTIPESEPWAANVVPVGETVCLATEHPRTAELIRRRGFAVRTTGLSEFARAEGGATCLSLLFTAKKS